MCVCVCVLEGGGRVGVEGAERKRMCSLTVCCRCFLPDVCSLSSLRIAPVNMCS